MLADQQKAESEVKVFQHLHKRYGDLVQYHLIRPQDEHDAINMKQTGPSLIEIKAREKLRKKTSQEMDWPKICKFMTQVVAHLDAVKHLHRANVEHLDIKGNNVVFGREPEPVKNVNRLPGTTYKNDVYLLGKNRILLN